MRNIVLRVQNRRVSTALESWRAMVAEKKRLRALLARAAAKMRHRRAARAK